MEIPFISDILNFLQSFWDWIYSGVYDFVKSAFVLLTKMAIYAYYQSMIFLLDVAYTAFEQIMSEIGVGQQVQNYYNSIDANVRAMIGFFGIPDALMIIFSAIGTRWTMKFVPLIGR